MELQRSSGIVLHPTSLPGGHARGGGLCIRGLARGRRTELVAGPAARPSRRGRLTLRILLGVRGLERIPGRAATLRSRAVSSRPTAARTPTGSQIGSERAGASPTRFGSTASGRRCASTPRARDRADRRRPDLRRPGQRRPPDPSGALPAGCRGGRTAGQARPAWGSTGAIRSSTGRRSRARATAGGSSGCGGRSRCTTSPGSITSAASPPSGRSRRARTISTPAPATGSPAPASRSSGRPRPSSASCP